MSTNCQCWLSISTGTANIVITDAGPWPKSYLTPAVRWLKAHLAIVPSCTHPLVWRTTDTFLSYGLWYFKSIGWTRPPHTSSADIANFILAWTLWLRCHSPFLEFKFSYINTSDERTLNLKRIGYQKAFRLLERDYFIYVLFVFYCKILYYLCLRLFYQSCEDFLANIL